MDADQLTKMWHTYCSNLYLQKDIVRYARSIQKFALQVCSNSGILVTLMSMLCSSHNLSTLAARRKQMKPCVMYKGVHGLADFPKTHNGQPLPSTKLQFPYTFSVLMLQSIKYTLFFFFSRFCGNLDFITSDVALANHSYFKTSHDLAVQYNFIRWVHTMY